MQVSEFLVRHVIAERHLEAHRNGLAKLVRASRDDEKKRIEADGHEGWENERFVPILRGYPVDPFYADRSR
jgi:hypothetical protein